MKSFLMISFIRSFFTKYPKERPLIVAPKSHQKHFGFMDERIQKMGSGGDPCL
jgi:hypothetical protein